MVESNFESSSDSDSLNDKIIAIEDDMCMLVLMAMHLYITMLTSFQPTKLSREDQISVNPSLPINDLLGHLFANPTQFKDLTNFTLEEFYELCTQVVSTIEGHARSTRVQHKVSGHLVKLIESKGTSIS